MKNLKQHINELKESLSIIFVKVFNRTTIKYLEEEHEYFQEYIDREERYIHSIFDVNNQRDTGYGLYEEGVLENIKRTAEVVFGGNNASIKRYSRKLKKAVELSEHFKLSKDGNYFWYMPAFEILGIDFNDIDEDRCIQSTKRMYDLD